MKLIITSATGSVLSIDEFLSLSCMTEAGQLTVLPDHEPLLTALRPGILTVGYIENDVEKKRDFVSGGGLLNVTPTEVILLSDAIDQAEDLEDLTDIEKRRQEAQELMEAYKKEHGANFDPRRLLAIEHDLLRYTAMHELGMRLHHPDGSRR